jgi:hypothetical protein
MTQVGWLRKGSRDKAMMTVSAVFEVASASMIWMGV